MRVIIRGAGDIATGIALRLYRARLSVIMTELAQPLSIRRTVCFSEAALHGEAIVEGIRAVRANGLQEAELLLSRGVIPLLIDPDASCKSALCPDALVDAILAKRNTGTRIDDAPIVIAVGPGFDAGTDCHAVVETKRGHMMGRVIWEGSAIANTGVPGKIGGYALERLLRAPCDGIFVQLRDIGAMVCAGDVVATVGDAPVACEISGILRGILPSGIAVTRGMKCGDVDPRCEEAYCYTASEKALAVGGGVLEALLCASPCTTLTLHERAKMGPLQ